MGVVPKVVPKTNAIGGIGVSNILVSPQDAEVQR
jgi:hypothetical protein